MMLIRPGWFGSEWSLFALFMALLYVFALVGAWGLAVVRYRRFSR
jgi:hypothetical protein